MAEVDAVSQNYINDAPAGAPRREDETREAFFLDVWLIKMARDAGFTDAEIAFILDLDDPPITARSKMPRRLRR